MQTFIFCYFVLQLVLTALWSKRSMPAAPAGIAASCLSAVSSLFLSVLSHLEHSRTLRPSATINVFLLSIIFDIAVVRTLWLSTYDADIRNVFTASFALKGVMLCLEAVEKQRYFKSQDDKKLSPYARAGVYSRTFFWWLNGLLLQGYRQELQPGDLHDLELHMGAEDLDRRFWTAWRESRKFLLCFTDYY